MQTKERDSPVVEVAGSLVNMPQREYDLVYRVGDARYTGPPAARNRAVSYCFHSDLATDRMSGYLCRSETLLAMAYEET